METVDWFLDEGNTRFNGLKDENLKDTPTE